MPSHLQSKSAEYSSAAALLYENKLYSTVAHSAYYSCYQLLEHIWIHTMMKTWGDLSDICRLNKTGSHDALINQVRNYIRNSKRTNCAEHMRSYYQWMITLKRLRVKADYYDEIFGKSESESAINLSNKISLIIRNYL
jgi:hypothetical protein